MEPEPRPAEPPRPPHDRAAAEGLERQLGDARLRVLVVGAGIAGATLAALLRRAGHGVALVERTPEVHDEGYMLGLLPLGGRVLNALDLGPAYLAASVEMRRYDLYDRHGRSVRRYPLGELVAEYGHYRGVERGRLLALLRRAAGAIAYETTVRALAQDEGRGVVRVTLHDDSALDVDLVVGADGIHSATRALVLRPDEVRAYDTGWSGYVLWTDGPVGDPHVYSERWSAGWGVGLYPVLGRCGVFLAGRREVLAARGVAAYAADLAGRVGAPFAEVFPHLELGRDAFSWRLQDRSATVWRRGRVVLLGDAASAPLPTAGVGASAALDSAAALADELSRADREHLEFALALYERRQRGRVTRLQRASRWLARLLFVDHAAAALARDQLLRAYSTASFTRSLRRAMEGR
ncbi:MAG: FAD-dependent monooxygenase [Planctomycetes bacterium]|nr:FAD-dependent monooxygenase [Planctomycetota bacterium]